MLKSPVGAKRKVSATEVQINGVAPTPRPTSHQINHDPNSGRTDHPVGPDHLWPAASVTIATCLFSQQFIRKEVHALHAWPTRYRENHLADDLVAVCRKFLHVHSDINV